MRQIAIQDILDGATVEGTMGIAKVVAILRTKTQETLAGIGGGFANQNKAEPAPDTRAKTVKPSK